MKMLKEVDQNIATNMSSNTNSPPTLANRDHLAIHSTNVYQPPKFAATTMAASPNRVFLAACRVRLAQGLTSVPFSKLDIYDISSKGQPRFLYSIIEEEDITELAWLDEKHLISVSKQATINVYSISLGVKTKVMTTDYGPITSMKYSIQDNLLVTGTEFGYAVGYHIMESGNLIACDKKMVKINGIIWGIDFHVKPRDIPMQVSITKEAKKPKQSSRKRKRTESSEEEEESDDNQEDEHASEDEFLATSDVTIYGACSNNKAVIWDYHKMKILDSVTLENDVLCVLALKNGNFVIGDSGGNLGVYDNLSFTCRQSERILESSILCLARNTRNSIVLASGQESIITLLKTDASSDSQDEYILFEQIKDHSDRVNCAIFTSKKEFFTCSDDDLVIKFRTSKSDGRRRLKRFVLKPNHQSRIICGINEVMTITGASLNVYDINADTHFRSELETYPTQQSLPAPKRTCLVKTFAYVHAATFDNKWICYSTKKGITILGRPGLDRLSKPSENLPNCHILKLCQSGRYLIAGQQKKIIITKLSDSVAEPDQGDEVNQVASWVGKKNLQEKLFATNHKMSVQETIFVGKFKGMVRDILYQQSDEQLIISCGTTRHFLYILQLPRTEQGCNGVAASVKVNHVHKIRLPTSPLSHLALNYHDALDSNLYIYTLRNQLIKCDVRSKSLRTDLPKLIAESTYVSNISRETIVQGLVILSRSHCLVYDTNRLLKLNIDNNEIVNETADYDNINTVSNTIFKQSEEILIV